MFLKKFCKYQGDCVGKNTAQVWCKKDGSIRTIGKSCGTVCPHYRDRLGQKMKRWWRGW